MTVKDNAKLSPFQSGEAWKCSTSRVIVKNRCHQLVPGTLEMLSPNPPSHSRRWVPSSPCLIYEESKAGRGLATGQKALESICLILKPSACADLGETAPPSGQLRRFQMNPCFNLSKLRRVVFSWVRGSTGTLGEGCAQRVLDVERPCSEESQQPQPQASLSKALPHIGSTVSVRAHSLTPTRERLTNASHFPWKRAAFVPLTNVLPWWNFVQVKSPYELAVFGF